MLQVQQNQIITVNNEQFSADVVNEQAGAMLQHLSTMQQEIAEKTAELERLQFCMQAMTTAVHSELRKAAEAKAKEEAEAANDE